MHELSDADIDALVAGQPVADAPVQLTELVGALRSEIDAIPTVKVSPALAEFIDITDTPTSPVAPRPSRPGVLAKAAGVFAAMSAKMLVGAMVAVAGVGGAHALGLVDVPGLPDTVSAEPSEPVANTPLDEPAPMDQDRMDQDPTDQGQTQPSGGSKPATGGVVVEPTTPSTESARPSGEASETDKDCEFGQETAETRSSKAAEQRQEEGRPVDPVWRLTGSLR